MNRKGSESKEKVLVELLYLTFNQSDERGNLKATFVSVLILVRVLIHVIIDVGSEEGSEEEGEEKGGRILVEPLNLSSIFSGENETLETTLIPVLVSVLVLVVFFLVVGLYNVPVAANKRERGSEGGEMDQEGSESRKRALVESLYLTSNYGDEKETLETTLVPVLIPIVVLISIVVLFFILGGVLVSTEREGEREGERGGGRGESDQRKTLSEERVVVESLYLISDHMTVFVLILIFVLILVFVPLPSTNILASNVFIVTVEREEKKRETISTLKVEDVDCRGAIGSKLPSVPNAPPMMIPNLPTLPNGSFKWQKSVWVSVVVHCQMYIS